MVSYMERGMRNPTLEIMLRITDALGVDLAHVIERASKVAAKRATR
jgi:transcriptional regulator with XRE-family HTH domain